MPFRFVLDIVQLVRSTVAAPFLGFAVALCVIAVSRLRSGRF